MGIGRLAAGGGARSSWLLAGALLVAQALACSAEERPTPASGPPQDPREILQQSVSRLLVWCNQS